MKLRFNAVRVHLLTSEGPFGARVEFQDGLNVIRAENTSGKSALVNAMLYALGLEVLVGKRGREALKPVLWSDGDYNDIPFSVNSSQVELEIANPKGKSITVRRYIAGERNSSLVEIVDGPLLTRPHEGPFGVEAYFVGVEGAAQRERGFHTYLASFLELDLPLVQRYHGEDVPLYMECIAPLLFIEQIRGWSGIQATLPQGFGIRSVAKLAVEYILALDAIENEKRRADLAADAAGIREDWHCIRADMARIAGSLGGTLVNVPVQPTAAPLDIPWIRVQEGTSEESSLEELLERKRHDLELLLHTDMQSPVSNEKLESELRQKEKDLFLAQAGLAQLRSDLHIERQEHQQLEQRYQSVKTEIRRNQDTKRLQDYGADIGLQVARNVCPTCSQPIHDALTPDSSAVLGIEGNIALLRGEAEAIKVLLASAERQVARLEGLETMNTHNVAALRMSVRDLRSDLVETQAHSISTIRQIVREQETVGQMEKSLEAFLTQVSLLDDTRELWIRNRNSLALLPGDYFSKQDHRKLDDLSRRFDENVKAFGYRSTGVSRLHISEDSYRPVCDDFEISFAASASDNIRLIWSFALSLLQVSLAYDGKHWGVLIFDEPEQQKMQDASSDALYSAIGAMDQTRFQVIVATSASQETTLRRLEGLPHSLFEFGDKVIRPLQE